MAAYPGRQCTWEAKLKVNFVAFGTSFCRKACAKNSETKRAVPVSTWPELFRLYFPSGTEDTLTRVSKKWGECWDVGMLP